MNKIFPQKCRTGKQYRERYVNLYKIIQKEIYGHCSNNNNYLKLIEKLGLSGYL